MKSISLEQQKFILNEKSDKPQGLSLMKLTAARNIVVEITWNPQKIKSAFKIQIVYMDRAGYTFLMNYSTLNFFSPSQRLFLGRQQAEKYKDVMCTYLLFNYLPAIPESDTNEAIEMNIAAYEFEDEKERETALIHSEGQRPFDGSMPDTKDAL